MNQTPLIYVDLIQAPQNPLAKLAGRQQRWRWRALNGGNGRVLAISSESYTNLGDCLAAIRQLFGSSSDVYLLNTAALDPVVRDPQPLRLATQIG